MLRPRQSKNIGHRLYWQHCETFSHRNRELFAENQRKEQLWVEDQRTKLQQDIEAQNRYWEAEMKRRAGLKAQQEEHQKYIDKLADKYGTTAEALCHEKSLSSLGKGLTIGTIKGGIFMLQTKVGGGKSESLKYVTNVFGEAARAGLSAVNENKSAKEIYEDTLKGGVNGLIFSVSDHAVGKASGFVGSHTGPDTCSKEEVEAVGTVISYMIKESATIR